MKKTIYIFTLIMLCNGLHAMFGGSEFEKLSDTNEFEKLSIPKVSKAAEASPVPDLPTKTSPMLTAAKLKQLNSCGLDELSGMNMLDEIDLDLVDWDLESASTNPMYAELQQELQKIIKEQEENNTLLSKLQDSENKVCELDIKNCKLQSENTSLKNQLEVFKRQYEELKEANKEKSTELKQGYSSLEKALYISSQRHEQKDLSTEEMKQNLKSLTEQNKSREIEVEKLKIELKSLTERYNQRTSEHDETLQSLSRNHDREIKMLKFNSFQDALKLKQKEAEYSAYKTKTQSEAESHSERMRYMEIKLEGLIKRFIYRYVSLSNQYKSLSSENKKHRKSLFILLESLYSMKWQTYECRNERLMYFESLIDECIRKFSGLTKRNKFEKLQDKKNTQQLESKEIFEEFIKNYKEITGHGLGLITRSCKFK
ncbi:hypothetical protein [Candidatus Nesciobacter abundans]|uniref:Uncharacterized protein n=1 Tax=Candidatus Nesciobacter abundans TaxID=2601668 RepID=A0A5C0UHA1_9PROT|nr:hypothetical protein [Candidatus Nesciobacter abundans]QEK38933.1 hypothetical protein FZC36_00575 [Candidatus Nesciobacter abundans]